MPKGNSLNGLDFSYLLYYWCQDGVSGDFLPIIIMDKMMIGYTPTCIDTLKKF